MRCEDSVIRREKGNQNVRGMFYVEGFDLEAVLSADSTRNSMHPVFEATLHFANLQMLPEIPQLCQTIQIADYCGISTKRKEIHKRGEDLAKENERKEEERRSVFASSCASPR